jgi:hypothetical protein
MSFKEANRRLHQASEILRYGVKGAAKREAEKRERLKSLKNRKPGTRRRK